MNQTGSLGRSEPLPTRPRLDPKLKFDDTPGAHIQSLESLSSEFHYHEAGGRPLNPGMKSALKTVILLVKITSFDAKKKKKKPDTVGRLWSTGETQCYSRQMCHVTP